MTEVWRDYVNEKPLSVANPKGNYRLKSTRVPRARSVATIVQNFFRKRRQICQRTVAKDVTEFLDGYGFITVDQENKKDVKYFLRSVQHYLCRLGYKRGNKKGMHNYKLREDNA